MAKMTTAAYHETTEVSREDVTGEYEGPQTTPPFDSWWNANLFAPVDIPGLEEDFFIDSDEF